MRRGEPRRVYAEHREILYWIARSKVNAKSLTKFRFDYYEWHERAKQEGVATRYFTSSRVDSQRRLQILHYLITTDRREELVAFMPKRPDCHDQCVEAREIPANFDGLDEEHAACKGARRFTKYYTARVHADSVGGSAKPYKCTVCRYWHVTED